MKKKAQEKVAIVTGGGAGIGRATALALARDGFDIAIADIDEAMAQETAEQIAALGQHAIFQGTDVAKAGDCEALISATLERFGHLDAAFNNAGIVGRSALTADFGAESWQRIIDVNLTGVFNCMVHELKVMRSTGGCIVNTASVMGLKGVVGGAAYCASKHGVIGLTRAAALEYGHKGVRINAICPGYVSTGLTVGESAAFTPEQLEQGVAQIPVRRLAAPEEIASLVAWLCSDAARYVTGAAYPIDGGISAG